MSETTNTVYVLNVQFHKSTDGGRSFSRIRVPHVDNHDLWINPEDPDHLILGSDGGVSASWDGTAHWRMFDNIALGQFYTIAYDMRDPYYVCGGLQDNDPWCGPSNTRSFHGIRHQDWYETAYDKTDELARIGKKKIEITGLNRSIEKHLAELGGVRRRQRRGLHIQPQQRRIRIGLRRRVGLCEEDRGYRRSLQ